MLTSKQLVEEGIITKVREECVAQVGIDLQVISIDRITGVGCIPTQGKTVLPTYEAIEWKNDKIYLNPGFYQVTFIQGCKFPSNVAGRIIQRSSLYRCGVTLDSPVFDPGFETENIGSFICVHNPVVIEKNARLGQIVCFRTEIEAEKYNGQWQNDKQRSAIR